MTLKIHYYNPFGRGPTVLEIQAGRGGGGGGGGGGEILQSIGGGLFLEKPIGVLL